MRVKTQAGRAKPIRRPSTLNPSSLNQDEAGKDVTLPDTYSDSDIGVQCGDVAPGTSAKVTLQSRNRDSEGMHKEFMDVNLLEKCCCLKCCRTGEMLVCAENGCPIAIHEDCLSCKPTVDESGKFYCPYCSYKRAVAEYQGKRRKVMLNKRSFTNFLKPKVAAQEKEQEEDGIVTVKETVSSIGSKKGDANDSIARNAVLQHQSKRLDQSQVKRKLRIDEAVQEEDSREVDNDLHNPVIDGWQTEASDTEHEGDGIAAVKETTSSIGSKKRGANDHVDDRILLDHVDEQQEEASDAGHEEDGEAMDYTDESSEDGDEMEHAVSPEKPYPKPAAAAGEGLRRVKTVAVKKSKKKSSMGAAKVKRRRLIWTAEEEEMLKEGVKKFERKNKNLPWRKILELGHEVFDRTRTPSDLKDKWKNIIARNLW